MQPLPFVTTPLLVFLVLAFLLLMGISHNWIWTLLGVVIFYMLWVTVLAVPFTIWFNDLQRSSNQQLLAQQQAANRQVVANQQLDGIRVQNQDQVATGTGMQIPDGVPPAADEVPQSPVDLGLRRGPHNLPAPTPGKTIVMHGDTQGTGGCRVEVLDDGVTLPTSVVHGNGTYRVLMLQGDAKQNTAQLEQIKRAAEADAQKRCAVHSNGN